LFEPCPFFWISMIASARSNRCFRRRLSRSDCARGNQGDPGARFQVRTGKRKFGGAAAPRERAGDPRDGARPRASRYGDEPRQSRQPLDRRSLDPVSFAHVRRESARTRQRTSRTSEPRRGPTWRERAIPSSYRACSICSRNRMWCSGRPCARAPSRNSVRYRSDGLRSSSSPWAM
jgi:hypothetical protein